MQYRIIVNSNVVNYSTQVIVTVCFMTPAKNPWFPRESQFTIIMSSNIRYSLVSTPKLPTNAVVYEVRLINSKEKVKLLRTPSIESDVAWKAHSLKFAFTALRKRLGNPHSAEDLISVISEHFPVGTQQAELVAEAIVTKFRNFYPQNAASSECVFPRKKIELPLSRLGTPFSVYQRCDMIYWLHLPQSCP